jgi:hypothetical protein
MITLLAIVLVKVIRSISIMLVLAVVVAVTLTVVQGSLQLIGAPLKERYIHCMCRTVLFVLCMCMSVPFCTTLLHGVHYYCEAYVLLQLGFQSQRMRRTSSLIRI